MTVDIVVLTGAGISAESGLKTFRDNGGLWEDHAIEDVATPEGFARNPALVQRFYNDRRHQLGNGQVSPNAAHVALTTLQQQLPAGKVLIVTQNVDNLHEQSGSNAVLHMHGELLKGRCQRTGKVVAVNHDLTTTMPCPVCQTPGCLRPHIVWFGEIPLGMDIIERALQQCQLFLSIGTSGHVYPAAGFVSEARHHGALCEDLNLDPSQQSSAFHRHHHGLASDVVPNVVTRILSGGVSSYIDQSGHMPGLS